MLELATIPYQRALVADWSALGNASLSIRERRGSGAAVLKVGRRVALPLDSALPAPNTWRQSGDAQWLWQGPREWLAISDSVDSKTMIAQTSPLTSGITATMVDVADRVLGLEVTGTNAAPLLASGTSLDPRRLAPGACCRTRFAALAVTIVIASTDGSFTLIADRASGVYLYSWLQRAIANLATTHVAS